MDLVYTFGDQIALSSEFLQSLHIGVSTSSVTFWDLSAFFKGLHSDMGLRMYVYIYICIHMYSGYMEM